jgi:hypothetical protein
MQLKHRLIHLRPPLPTMHLVLYRRRLRRHRNMHTAVSSMIQQRNDARQDDEESDAEPDAGAYHGFVAERGARGGCCAL